jgi:hypothetical protein
MMRGRRGRGGRELFPASGFFLGRGRSTAPNRKKEVAMWSSFFAAGGSPMYAVSLFGFLLVAASVRFAVRPRPDHLRLALLFGVATFMTGLLGTAIGVCLSAHYIQKVPLAQQIEIFALGIDESLHNLILSLFLVVAASLIAAAGAFRGPGRALARTVGAGDNDA